MLLPAVLLPLAAMLQQSLGEEPLVAEINEKLQMKIIEQINNLRREVKPSASNMLKMRWSEEAAANARKYASKCQFRNSPKEDRKLGDVTCSETLSQTETARPWRDIIEAWASAQQYFKFGSLPTDGEQIIYSYTQNGFVNIRGNPGVWNPYWKWLIWYNSHEVGCALVHCPESASPYFYLCHFCPGGNIQGKLAEPYKKGPSCEACPGNCEDKLCTNPCSYVNLYDRCKEMLQNFKCSAGRLAEYCQASCYCLTEII